MGCVRTKKMLLRKIMNYELTTNSGIKLKKIHRFNIAIAIAFIFIASNASGQYAILKSDADSLVRKGADYIYNVKFDSATKCFNEVMRKYPGHPAGYFLDAMVEWWKIKIYLNNTDFDDVFLSKIDKVIEVCDRMLEINSKDLTALFFKGGALGYRGQYHAIRKQWLSAAGDGKEAFEIMLLCHEKAPGNHDIMLGTGVYNYFAEAIPEQYPLLKPLTLFIPRGDKKIGVLQLKSASIHARYAPVEAKVVLLQIYYSFEKNYNEAIHVAGSLHNSYPDNPYFHRYYARCYVKKGDLANYEKQWREILIRRINNMPGYDNLTAREALYYIGQALMIRGKYKDALKYLYKCDEACRILDDEPSGFMVEANMKIAKIFQIRGERENAAKQYRKILSMKEYNDSHSKAEKRLENLEQ